MPKRSALLVALLIVVSILSTSGCTVLDWMTKHEKKNPPPAPKPLPVK
jgi:hypothetical protein